jgi:HEPN domain-containing protein
MEKRTEEWLKQSAYDLDTADYMYAGGKYLYAVFMCHLSIEKLLKGLYYERLRQIPPKSHSLVFLLNEMGIEPPEVYRRFILKLSEASIPTRYPEDLAKVQQDYTQSIVKDILAESKETMVWIKQQL